MKTNTKIAVAVGAVAVTGVAGIGINMLLRKRAEIQSRIDGNDLFGCTLLTKQAVTVFDKDAPNAAAGVPYQLAAGESLTVIGYEYLGGDTNKPMIVVSKDRGLKTLLVPLDRAVLKSMYRVGCPSRTLLVTV